MRDAIFLNIIFALMMFSIDNFTNFDPDAIYEVALNCTPAHHLYGGHGRHLRRAAKSKRAFAPFLLGFVICIPILIMAACLEYR